MNRHSAAQAEDQDDARADGDGGDGGTHGRIWCRFQKASTGSWLLGSLTTIVHESIYMLGGSLDKQRGPDDKDEEWQRRQQAIKAQARKRALVLAHAVAQVPRLLHARCPSLFLLHILTDPCVLL
jgi:hypothetical protein